MENLPPVEPRLGFTKAVVTCAALLLAIFLIPIAAILLSGGLVLLIIPFAHLLLVVEGILYLILFIFAIKKLIFLHKASNKAFFLSQQKKKYTLLHVILILSIILPLVQPIIGGLQIFGYKREEAKKDDQQVVICNSLHSDFAQPVTVQSINPSDSVGNGAFFVGDKNTIITPIPDSGNEENPNNIVLTPEDVIGKKVTIEVGPCEQFRMFVYRTGKETPAEEDELFKNYPYDHSHLVSPGKVYLDGHRIYTYYGKIIEQVNE